ncbi:MAG: TonB family protein [Myxococcales bacterium]
MPRDEFRRGRRGNSIGLLVTLALHGAVLAAVGIAHGQPTPPLIVQRDFVLAEMVKFGKPRDKFWLPRITQPPRPQAPAETLKVAEDPDAKPAPKEAPRPEDPKISKTLKSALNRARMLENMAEEEPEEGALNGSKFGTSNQAVGDQYLAEVKGMLLQNYNLPAGIAPDQISTAPEIRFHISADGTLTDIKLSKSSGNGFVDDACVQAAQLTRKVGPPPPTVRGIRVACEK